MGFSPSSLVVEMGRRRRKFSGTPALGRCRCQHRKNLSPEVKAQGLKPKKC
jgi:hypothetical protein